MAVLSGVIQFTNKTLKAILNNNQMYGKKCSFEINEYLFI